MNNGNNNNDDDDNLYSGYVNINAHICHGQCKNKKRNRKDRAKAFAMLRIRVVRTNIKHKHFRISIFLFFGNEQRYLTINLYNTQFHFIHTNGDRNSGNSSRWIVVIVTSITLGLSLSHFNSPSDGSHSHFSPTPYKYQMAPKIYYLTYYLDSTNHQIMAVSLCLLRSHFWTLLRALSLSHTNCHLWYFHYLFFFCPPSVLIKTNFCFVPKISNDHWSPHTTGTTFSTTSYKNVCWNHCTLHCTSLFVLFINFIFVTYHSTFVWGGQRNQKINKYIWAVIKYRKHLINTLCGKINHNMKHKRQRK